MANSGILKGLVNSKYRGSVSLHVGSCTPQSCPDAWKFLGNTQVTLNTESASAKWKNYYFKENKATFKQHDDMTAEIVIDKSQKKCLLCTESQFITNLLHHDFKIM